MSNINVTPQEVRSYANQLNNWGQQMKSIRQSIVGKTHQLEAHWKDPQYMMFVETTNSHAAQLKSSIDLFEKMGRELLIMANELENAMRLQQARVRNMRS